MTIGANGGQHRSLSALLLLTDGRFPAGGHAHSGGLEAAVRHEGVHDLPDLDAFLRGRAETTGAMSAAFAAAACARASDPALADDGKSIGDELQRLDRELDVRLPSPAVRRISRRLGRQMLRAGRTVWPHTVLEEIADAFPGGVHQPVALGAVAAAAGLPPASAASAAAFESVAGPATAAVRLLGLDPFAVNAVLARLGPVIDAIAAEGVTCSHIPPERLPAPGAPLLDLLAEQHATWEVRLFAS